MGGFTRVCAAMRGGANGARIRLAPQKDWEANDPAEVGCCREDAPYRDGLKHLTAYGILPYEQSHENSKTRNRPP